jgi:hypothetical protein
VEYEYKVIDVADGAISSFLLGEGRIETNVLEAYLNAVASESWRMVFMEKVMQRHLVVANLQPPVSISICPKCRAQGSGDVESCHRCGHVYA